MRIPHSAEEVYLEGLEACPEFRVSASEVSNLPQDKSLLTMTFRLTALFNKLCHLLSQIDQVPGPLVEVLIELLKGVRILLSHQLS